MPNAYIADLLPKMVDDMFEITIDPLFPPKNPVKRDQRPNYFELLYCQSNSDYSKVPVNVRSSYSKSVYPISELDPTTHSLKYTLQPELQPPTTRNLKYTRQVELQPKEAKREETKSEEMKIAETKNEETKQVSEEGDVPTNQRSQTASPEKRRIISVTNPTLTIEGILQNVQSSSYFRNLMNVQAFDCQITFVISNLIRWEQLTPKDVENGCKALLAISNCQGMVILAEQKNILEMSKLLSTTQHKY